MIHIYNISPHDIHDLQWYYFWLLYKRISSVLALRQLFDVTSATLGATAPHAEKRDLEKEYDKISRMARGER